MPTADGRIKGISVPDVPWLRKPQRTWSVLIDGVALTRTTLYDKVIRYWEARGGGDADERHDRAVGQWARIAQTCEFDETSRFWSYGMAVKLAEAIQHCGGADWSVEVVADEEG